MTYTPYTIYRCMSRILAFGVFFSYPIPIDGFYGWFKLLYKDGWKCMRQEYLHALTGMVDTLCRHHFGRMRRRG